ncbi:MAG: hypothetical protein GXY36_07320 [Chloroflexi bacterium]|nr:hypothetical protein [Chloroflexota bacterium]
MTSRSTTRSITIFLSLLTVLALSGAVAFQALAQDDSPTGTPEPAATAEAGETPVPAQVGDSSVEWVVEETSFASDYPAGFTFRARIESSAGPISRARIVWSHVPGTQRTRPASVDADTGELVATWNATGADAVPPWVGLTYYWDVTDAEGNTLKTTPEYAEYADDSREWIRTESEDIIVFTQNLPEEVGPMTVEAMAEQRETYREAWGDLLPYKPRAILFGDREAWDEWQITAGNRNVIGQTSDDWGGTVQVVSGGDLVDLAYGTVLHEVGHLYQPEFTIMTAGSWFIEGNATFFELNQQYDYLAGVRQLATSGNLPVLLQDTGPGVSGQFARRGYDIGYTFWVWLVENYGLEGHRELIELLAQGLGRNTAIEQVTGLTIDEVESRWRVWLGASAVAPTLFPTPTLLMFPSPTPFGQ